MARQGFPMKRTRKQHSKTATTNTTQNHGRLAKMPSSSGSLRAPLALLLLAISYDTHLATAASVTNGPLAPVSVAVSNAAYSTARECARYCLEYAGIWNCNYNAGYYGLGKGLGCGCASTNGCFCNVAYATSATSYLSSCISAGCEKIVGTGWTSELDTMLGLYDGYCSTANIEQALVSWMPTATAGAGGSSGDGGAAATAAVTGTGPTNAAATATSNPLPGGNNGGEGEKNSGLSQSDIVALAASLGVGIPSLLIAGITLCIQLRKKKRRAEVDGQTTTLGQDGYFESSTETTAVNHYGGQRMLR